MNTKDPEQSPAVNTIKKCRPSRFIIRRRIALAGEVIGVALVLGPGLTSDLSGLPFIIAGVAVVLFSLLLHFYTLVAERRGLHYPVSPTER